VCDLPESEGKVLKVIAEYLKFSLSEPIGFDTLCKLLQNEDWKNLSSYLISMKDKGLLKFETSSYEGVIIPRLNIWLTPKGRDFLK
jgi:predicted transcriptional regulator